MNVEALLENYSGSVEFWDSSTSKQVCTTTGDSPLIMLLGEYEVLSWSIVRSRLIVMCQFTEPDAHPDDNTTEIPDEVTEG